jgi:dihydrofolate reductase
MIINIIAAVTRRGGLGLNNKIPWNLKSEMSNFKKLTVGDGNNSIIMGKNTWISLNRKPLKNRKNIVISSTLNDFQDDVKVVCSLDEALEYCKQEKIYKNWIIGGARIYDDALNNYIISNVHLTRVETDIVCDTFFPHIHTNYNIYRVDKWMVENDIQFRFENYRNKNLSTQIQHTISNQHPEMNYRYRS